MTWLLLTLGFFLMLTGVLGQIYSLKTKRGVVPHETRLGRRIFRLAFFLVGLVLVGAAVARILHYWPA